MYMLQHNFGFNLCCGDKKPSAICVIVGEIKHAWVDTCKGAFLQKFVQLQLFEDARIVLGSWQEIGRTVQGWKDSWLDRYNDAAIKSMNSAVCRGLHCSLQSSGYRWFYWAGFDNSVAIVMWAVFWLAGTGRRFRSRHIFASWCVPQKGRSVSYRHVHASRHVMSFKGRGNVRVYRKLLRSRVT